MIQWCSPHHIPQQGLIPYALHPAQEFNLDVGSSAALSLMPWAANVVCTNLAGWLGDRAVEEAGADRTTIRKVMQGIASLGPAACLLALAADQGASIRASSVNLEGNWPNPKKCKVTPSI